MNHLLYSFPAIRELAIWTEDFESTDRIMELRNVNRAVDASAASAAWSKLIMFKGTLNGLFILGLSSTAFHVYIRIDDPQECDANKLATVLQDTKPTLLRLDICTEKSVRVDVFKQSGSESVIEGIQIITIKLDLTGSKFKTSEDVDDYFQNLHGFINKLRTPFLCLHILFDTSSPRLRVRNLALKPYLRSIDPQSIAVRISRGNTQILFIYVAINGHTPGFWRVHSQTPSSNSPMLKEFPTHFADRIMDPQQALKAADELKVNLKESPDGIPSVWTFGKQSHDLLAPGFH
ncbi:hypothetical protein ABKN59_007650 [Abortiporus biennis]